MISLLEVVVTFVGTMFILALAAERLQEIVKASLALKSWTRLSSVRRLVIEAARAQGLLQTDGEEIVEELVQRLRNLGQNGLRSKAVRLDAIDKCQLSGLIVAVDAARVSGLKIVSADEARKRLQAIGRQTEEWFDLAMEPVADRYRRRMQLWAVAAALVIVGVLNADALAIVRRARSDPAFRQAVATQAARLLAADSAARLRADSTAGRDTGAALRAPVTAHDSAAALRDSLLLAATTGSQALFQGYPKGWKFSWQWLLGILFSTLLVSLGAPFWHDVLEGVFGWKNKVRSEAAPGASRTP
jgi:hypothetical protein